MFNAGVRGKRAKDGTGFISSTEQFVQQTYLIPTVTSFSVTDVSYVPLDNTAVDTAGGETIVINGSGFAPGATVQVGATTIGSVTFIDQNRLAFSAPALSSGSYTIYVTNSNGGTGILLSGLVYSGLPTFTTTAGTLGTVYETANINTSVVATGDAPITYTLLSGTLPAGANINSNGTITGTAPVDGSSTTYSFTIQASDGQLQDSTRAFTLTINTDVLSFSLANNTVYSLDGGTAMSNVTLSATSSANANSAVTYAANTLPTGISLSGNTIFGTPTVEQTVYTAVTATATQTGRTATRFVSWVVSLADAFFKYNTLAINSETSSNSTFVKDASTNNFAVSIFGDTKPNNFNPYTPGYYSNYFDGSGDYLAITGTPISATGTFTVECWINTPSINTAAWIYTQRQSISASRFGIALVPDSTGFHIDVSLGSQASPVSTTNGISYNTWNHIAVVRDSSNNLKIFINGVLDSTTASYTYSIEQSEARIGFLGNSATQYFLGYISNTRVTNTAVYSTTFTPSTIPLTAISGTTLLTCQSNRFIDNSTNNFALTVAGNTSISSFDPFVPNSSYSTYGSGYFDGTGDYLTVPDNAALEPGSSNLTWEMWINTTNSTQYATLYSRSPASFQVGMWSLLMNIASSTTGDVAFYAFDYNNNTPLLQTSGVSVRDGSWHHIAVVRNGSAWNLYVDGVSRASATWSGTISDIVGNVYIGQDQFYTRTYTGYISDFRVVKGTAVYTTSFTPPTAPLTAIANTSLLTLQNNQSVNNNVFLDNSTNNFLVTRSGNTTQGTFSPYGGNWSNYFDGTGDYLTTPTGQTALTLGTNNFTIDLWCFPTAQVRGNPTLFSSDPGVGLLNAILVQFTSTGQTVLWVNNTNLTSTSTTNYMVLNQWNHVAVCRSGASAPYTYSMYINGVAVNNVATNSSSITTNSWLIGYWTVADNAYTGYISNFRIVKGTALYSGSTITPSTTPLTTTTETTLLTCADNRLVDDSINNFTITKNGDVSVQRFSPFNPSSVTPTSYSWNLYTDGSYQITGNATLSSLSTGAFTVEGWHYPTRSLSSRNVRILSLGRDSTAAAGDTSWDLYISNGSALVWQRIQTTATTYSANYTFNINTWYHIVACRDSSSNLALFVNGTRILLQANVTTNYDYIAGTSVTHYVGATYNNVVFDYAWGYYSNIRVIKGATAYDPTQSTLTVPTSPLSVTSQTSVLLFGNNGSDLSGNYPLSSISRIDSQSKMDTFNPFGFTSALTNGYTANTVGGSAYFDGTGDYLTIAGNSAFNFGTSNFTLECWVFQPNINAGTRMIAALTPYTTSNTGWGLYFGAGYIAWFVNGANRIVSSNPIAAGTWNHLAIVRSSSSTVMYINGVVAATAYSDSTNYSGTTQYIGSDATQNYSGYISDFRVVKGTALYTASFIPPSAPLTAVQNTVLLNNFTNAAIADYSMMNNLETVGDAKLSTTVSKFGGSSMSFDGTGDCLFEPSNINYGYGTGDFTIEFWLYLNATTTQTIVSNLTASSGASVAPHIYYANASGIRYYVNSSDRITGSALSTSTWYHIAVSRSGSSTKMFINGTQTGSTYTDTNNYGTANPLGVADYAVPPTGGGNLNGYIDELRITKGYARYTSNFTAPITSFKTK